MLKTPIFVFLPYKIGRGRKSGWAWSETFENRNKRNAFLRFILKENGFKTKKWEQNAKRSVFRNFTCIRKSKKGRGHVAVFPKRILI